ncbi:MAG: GDP-mannose 4,6-dehydratase [bacterium]|nr:GDP-mannose 4,6-dehydratase [bacterium]
MKILITGGAGFIGSHLVELLVKNGHTVRVLVKPNEKTTFLSPNHSEIIYGDIREEELLKVATREIDIVYHLASVPRLIKTVLPQEYKSVNTDGTRTLLEVSKRAGVQKFIYVSTIEAVGPSIDGNPLNEKTAPNPVNIYGKSKWEAEKITTEYYTKHGMHTVIVRLPMIYGPHSLLQLQRLFKIINKGYYPLIGDGKTLMEFCYVKNIVLGIKLAGEKGKAGETYFISDERSYSIEEVVKEIANQLNIDLQILYIPVPIAMGVGVFFEFLSKIFRFPPFRVKETGKAPFSRSTVEWTSKNTFFCDTSKVKRELGYKPTYTLSDGIKETIMWYREIGAL